MRLIDADELMEHVWRDKLDSRELIAKMIDNRPTVKDIPINIPINIFEQLISQESCEDCISRRDALNAITMAEVRWQAVKHIKELPSLLPQKERKRMTKVEIDSLQDIVDTYEKDGTCSVNEEHIRALKQVIADIQDPVWFLMPSTRKGNKE